MSWSAFSAVQAATLVPALALVFLLLSCAPDREEGPPDPTRPAITATPNPSPTPAARPTTSGLWQHRHADTGADPYSDTHRSSHAPACGNRYADTRAAGHLGAHCQADTRKVSQRQIHTTD